MSNWSTDADLVLKEPAVLDCFPRERAALVSGADGATGATGLTFTSATIGSGFVTAGVAADMYLEVTEGQYQGFYRVASLVAATLTLDRPIGASLTSLAFRVRTFASEHSEAHQHYLDRVLRAVGSLEDGSSSDEVFEESEIHARSQRDLRDLCVARVLGSAFRAAAAGQENSAWWKSAEFWARKERELQACLDRIEMDTDGDSAIDSKLGTGWGSVEAQIS
jgi:hypothetical protein